MTASEVPGLQTCDFHCHTPCSHRGASPHGLVHAASTLCCRAPVGGLVCLTSRLSSCCFHLVLQGACRGPWGASPHGLVHAASTLCCRAPVGGLGDLRLVVQRGGPDSDRCAQLLLT